MYVWMYVCSTVASQLCGFSRYKISALFAVWKHIWIWQILDVEFMKVVGAPRMSLAEKWRVPAYVTRATPRGKHILPTSVYAVLMLRNVRKNMRLI